MVCMHACTLAVAWGKHTPQHFRLQHAAVHAMDIQKEHVLPVITVRNPWRWMQSMVSLKIFVSIHCFADFFFSP